MVSVFGNDPDVFYDKLLEGVSGVGPIDRFDASKFPTRFAAQIRNFSSEGYIDGKNDRRLDDCLRYCLVAGKKALESADLGGEKLSKVSTFCVSLYRVYVQSTVEQGFIRTDVSGFDFIVCFIVCYCSIFWLNL